MSVAIAGYALLAVALCTIHFCLGVWFGESHEGRMRQNDLPKGGGLDAQSRHWLAEVIALAKHARLLSDTCSGHGSRLPPDVMREATSLAENAVRLQLEMESLRPVLPRPRHKRRRKGNSDSTLGQPSQLQAERQRGAVSKRTRLPVAWQYIAPRQGETYPTPDQFAQVLCRNLTGKGFSYFSTELPTTDALIVGLGTPPELQFFLIEITQIVPTSVNGEEGHCVDCRFVRKLLQIYHWDEEHERIGSASTLSVTG